MRRLLPLLLITLPLLLGLGMAVLMQRGVLPNLLWVGRFEVDVAALLVGLGTLLSLLLALLCAIRQWMAQRLAQVRHDAAVRQSAERRRFLRRLDHELKNPLQIIRLGVANLRANPELPREQAGSLARLAHQAQRLQELVEGLRQLAELGEHELERGAVDLREVLEEAVLLACGQQPQRSDAILLSVQQVPWPLSPVLGDRDLLIMAFHNLLENALKFSENGGPVEVRAAEDGGVAVTEVADAGPGIPSEDIPLIFDELYRGQNVQTVAGSGLGLALVQRIVLLHNGEIRVRSRIGQGTAVTVRLPLAPER